MKKLLIIAQCCTCFLLAITNTQAQNSAAPAAQKAPGQNELKPNNKPTTTNKAAGTETRPTDALYPADSGFKTDLKVDAVEAKTVPVKTAMPVPPPAVTLPSTTGPGPKTEVEYIPIPPFGDTNNTPKQETKEISRPAPVTQQQNPPQ